MISRIEGELVSVDGAAVEIECGPLTYELSVPAFDLPRLTDEIGRPVVFHTRHYYESHNQGATLIPRLIGFRSPDDRAFFDMFTTVKGMGSRKALRALQAPFGAVARAIAGKDIDFLVGLPEIGKRTAQTIVAELHGKLDRFVEMKPLDGPIHAVDAEPSLTRDAATVLVQLGEQPQRARHLVERALGEDPTIDSPDALVAAAFRVKESGA